MKAAARKLCRQMGIQFGLKSGPMQTCSGNVIGHLIDVHGEANMVLTLRLITESSLANQSQLNRNVITAVNDICRIKRFTRLGLRLIEAFDSIDLGAMNADAQKDPLSRLYSARTVLACQIILALERLLGDAVLPAKRPVAVRVVVADRLALGAELLKLKASAGKSFKRAAYDRFGIDNQGDLAGRSMRVAAAYGARPEITSNLSWNALAALSAISFPVAARRRVESRILAGERINAEDIEAAAGKRTRRVERAKMAAAA